MKILSRGKKISIAASAILGMMGAAVIGPATASPAHAATGPVGGIVAMKPTRILDTRTSTGPVPGGGSVSIRISGANGFPSSTQAVVVNITATEPTAAGFLTAFHSGVSAPRTSNVNYGPGQTVANLAIVEVGADGQIAIANTSNGTVQIVVDASGYFDASGPQDAPGSYQPVAPTRLLDTRVSSGPIPGGGVMPIRLGGSSGVPATASAVVVNLTVTQSSSFGFISAYPAGSARPNVSNQNYGTGQTIPNLAVVPVGADGSVAIANTSTGTAHVVADVLGYFLPGVSSTSGAFAPVSPTRLLDTRMSGGPVPSAYVVPFQVAGVAGVPRNASGVWVNLTVTEPTIFGFFTIRGYQTPWFQLSNLNFGDRQTIANMAFVPIGADGKLEIQPLLAPVPRLETTQIIVDVFGYTTP